MKHLLKFVCCVLLFTSCESKIAVKVDYEGIKPSPALKFSVEDLTTYVLLSSKELRQSGVVSADFSLRKDNTLKEGAFGYSVSGTGKVVFAAGDEMGISHAIYTFLEELGYTFDVTGTSLPEKVNVSAFQPGDTVINPTVRWRGIRQHVNFPMDISSYRIEDAKEYVDRLVRMRFNKLTIHSYPGQWYETILDDSLSLAGNFFYGNKHYMYDNELLKKMIPSNDSLFCIPAAEKLKDKPEAVSKMAINWMQELIRYAKSLGFYVQFSFEPRVCAVEQAIRTAKEIQQTYPEIDALELITEETGGWGSRCTEAEVEETLKTYFPAEVASDSIVRNPIRPQQSDLKTLYEQIGIITQAIQTLDKQIGNKVELKLGIYCSVTPYTVGAYRLARLALPETKVCLMSSHGSDGTAKAIPQVIRSASDLRQTEIYSWIEFDGLMYLLQNSIAGNNTLMQELLAILPGQQSSVLYNHWRTAENRISARYVAEETLNGSLSSDEFYKQYALRLGITDAQKFKEALTLINQVDVYSTTHLGNIGFCWMGAWRTGGSFTWMKKDNIEYARDLYFRAGNLFAELLKSAEKGSAAHSYLEFVENRVLCTVLYLDAFKEAVNIQTIQREADGTIPESEQLRARQICDKALLIFDQYMEVHSRMLPDRGCEGTLVSVWNAPVRGLKIYREQLGGVPMDRQPALDGAVDAPPLPILYKD